MGESAPMTDPPDAPSNQGAEGEAAIFLGWQETARGNAIPLYTVTVRDHPLFGSTVSDRTLREQHLPIPTTPPKGP